MAASPAPKTAPRPAVPERGTVVRVTRRETTARLSDGSEAGRLIRCAVGGRLFGRSRNKAAAAALVVGDEVAVERLAVERGRTRRRHRSRRSPEGRITEVLPRRNELRRTVGRVGRRETRTFAANLDLFFIVSAFRAPPYRTGFLDRALVVAFDARVTPALVFNKVDLADADDVKRLRRDLAGYGSLDLDVHVTSALGGDGLAAFRAAASRGRSVLFGHSGVGKTELLAALGISGRRSRALDRRGRGRHTTTGAEIVPLPGGGEIVDTPGVRALGLDGLTAAEVRAAHPDVMAHADGCRFAGCSHESEPDCAVKRAVASGAVARSRYESLITLSAEAAGLEAGRTPSGPGREPPPASE